MAKQGTRGSLRNNRKIYGKYIYDVETGSGPDPTASRSDLQHLLKPTLSAASMAGSEMMTLSMYSWELGKELSSPDIESLLTYKQPFTR